VTFVRLNENAIAAICTSRLSCGMLGKREYLREFGSHPGNPGSKWVLLRAIYAAVNRTCMPVRGVSLSTNSAPAGTVTEGAGSAWSPFRHKAYAVLWIATVVSNIGTWMYNAASGCGLSR
jgi:hypothetical protein